MKKIISILVIAIIIITGSVAYYYYQKSLIHDYDILYFEYLKLYNLYNISILANTSQKQATLKNKQCSKEYTQLLMAMGKRQIQEKSNNQKVIDKKNPLHLLAICQLKSKALKNFETKIEKIKYKAMKNLVEFNNGLISVKELIRTLPDHKIVKSDIHNFYKIIDFNDQFLPQANKILKHAFEVSFSEHQIAQEIQNIKKLIEHKN